MVIWSHAYAINNPEKLIEPVSRLTGTETGGSLAVHLFFFISGLLVTNSILTKKNIADFISARFFRIFPAYALLILITAIIIGPALTNLSTEEYFSIPSWYGYISNNLSFNTQYDLPGVFTTNIYPGSVNGAIWTIRYEIICYIFLLILFLLWLPRKKIIGTIICLTIILEPFTGILKNYIEPFNHIDLSLMYSCFAFGALFAFYKNRIKLNYLFLTFVMVCYLISVKFFPSVERIFLSLVICTIFLYLSSTKPLIKLHLKYDISYGVYLWGFLIQQIVSYFFSLGIHLSQITSVLVSILIGFISSKYIEMPAMKLHKKIINTKLLGHKESIKVSESGEK
jgi:peptidoglycan/LPS O-acetylase OafA/YrhL